MATKTFEVNGKLYKAKDFNFNLLCDLEEQGLSLEDVDKKPMSLVRAYFMFCAGLSKDKAGLEIESHVENGGDFTDIVNIISEQMQDSGFFRSLSKTTEEEEEETSTESQKSDSKKA